MVLVEALFFVVAVLYSSTGHGGGSGYLAVMLLLGLAPASAAPIALTLNLLVASMAVYAFHQAGGAAPKLALPIVLVSAPVAYLGGSLALDASTVAVLVGPALFIAAALLVLQPDPTPREGRLTVLLLMGAGLGFLAGVTGIGGGIYLTPVLLIGGWAGKDEAAWTSAVFILVNSVAGLAARAFEDPAVIAGALPYLIPVGIGGVIGSMLGSRVFSPTGFRRAMAGILLLAAIKTLASVVPA